ncbi:MAG: replication initiation factor domain-containing protein [Planctomycetes bacterium]|nr:replication initiation factor domain-containing protein [Planctomycetota bacterium]
MGRGSGGTAGGPPAFDASGVKDSAIVFTSDAGNREGEPSNTPSQKTTTGGEDWLSVNFYVDFSDFDELSEQLNLAQAAAVDLDSKGSSDETPVFHDEIELCGIRFIVAPRGARLGGGRKALGMKWRLQSEHGLSVLIANMPAAHKTVPNVNVVATSLPLMQLGFDAAWALMQDYVEALGGERSRNKLSRVDACVDLPDVSVEDFCTPFAKDWIVSRARQRDLYESGVFLSSHKAGRISTGFAVGKSPLRLRVYDKLIESRRSPEKLALLEARRWGYMPEKATRVEIQLSRAKLKQYGVDTVEDWIAKRATIVDQLTCNWFRLTDGPVDRNHANRTPTHPVWKEAREAFFQWCKGARNMVLEPLPKLHVDMSKQMKQIVGMFIGIFARIGKPISDNAMFFREVEFAVRDIVGKRDMCAEVQRRALETFVNSSTIDRRDSDDKF